MEAGESPGSGGAGPDDCPFPFGIQWSLENKMMRRIIGLLTASALIVGCGSGGIEGGIPSDAAGREFSKATDPMAGAKVRSTSDKSRPAFDDPMNPGRNALK
jgi:hypothetical protein